MSDDLWIHICIGPNGFEDFILRYESIGMLDQIAKYIKCLRGERHTVLPLPQAVVNDVEPEGMELFHCVGPVCFSRQEVVSKVYDIDGKFTLVMTVRAHSISKANKTLIPPSTPMQHAKFPGFRFFRARC